MREATCALVIGSGRQVKGKVAVGSDIGRRNKSQERRRKVIISSPEGLWAARDHRNAGVDIRARNVEDQKGFG